MRKYIMIVGLVLASVVVGCVTTTIAREYKVVEETYHFPGLEQEILYNRARLWIANYFVSYEAVTKFDDKELGELRVRYKETIIGNVTYDAASYSYKTTYENVPRAVIISVRDNKAGIRIEGDVIVYEQWEQGAVTTKPETKKVTSIEQTVKDFGDAMKKDYNKEFLARPDKEAGATK